MKYHVPMVAVLVAILMAFAVPAGAADKKPQEPPYLIGGPLSGVKLPLFPTQNGEAPGYPGCIPELMKQGKEVRDMGNDYIEWGPQGLAPEWDLYPGSVEHWRAYMFKYMPIRSMFDRQSQIRNWVAPNIPGADKAQIDQYAAPVYWVPRHAPVRDTGRTLKPVPVIRCTVKTPVFNLDLGELPPSMYAVRVIAAVETDKLRAFRRPVFLRMRVNDGLKNEVTEYKRRIGYCDEFYSVCEFYFNAPEARPYHVQLWVAEGSEVDLLVSNLSVDDVLAGAVRAAIKTKVTLAADPARPVPTPSKFTAEERLARDAALWNYFPPLNHQASGNTFRQASFNAIFPPEVTFGADGKSRQDIANEFGPWIAPRSPFAGAPGEQDVFIANPKLNLKYTLDDLAHYRPLPDPYPYKDDGAGLYFVDPKDPGKGQVLAEIGIEVMQRIRSYPTLAKGAADAWRKRGDVDAARDGVIALARYAYAFPSIESAAYLCNLTRDPAAYGRNLYNRRRETAAMFMTHYANYLDAPTWYDELYDFIPGNQDLADSIHRFIPWAKTPEDVIKLLDVYLVQTTAKRVMRYQYHTGPMGIAELAAVLGPGEATAPWLDWLFARTFIYPLPPAGVQDLMIAGNDRTGTQYIGSTFYAQGENAMEVAQSLQRFKDLGVLPAKYDLTDPVIYPKPLAHCYWPMDVVMGGLDFCRIGDVGGPDKTPGATLGSIKQAAINGWLWSHDPKFAWVIKNQVGKAGYSDAEWAAIEKAAATVPRAPWLDNRSRQLYNWFGALEAGVESSQFSARRGAYVRIGAGIGHHHDDSLDLQFYAQGLPMTVDGGQRPAYCTPGDRTTRVHNLVEVDAAGHGVNSWVRLLSDAEGARYMSVDAAPPHAAKLFRRNVALLDVDTHPANSYIFDVFRVAGGQLHTYCFHGPITDEVLTNAEMQAVPAPATDADANADQQYLRMFKRSQDSWRAGGAPSILETTWRYSRTPGPGCEQSMLGRGYSDKAPRKFTRLHLFDVAGDRVLRADAVCYKWSYKYHCQFVQRHAQEGNNLQSAFTAVYEPYADDPFIVQRDSMTIPGNEDDALKAVAVQVTTTSGQKDICFSDGRPEKTRQVGPLQVAGEFAYYSTDDKGLRSAALTGGTLLKAPDIEIRVARREYTGKITAVDYRARTLNIDAVWPASTAGNIFEIAAPGRTTSYTSTTAAPAAAGSVITVSRGADYFRSQVEAVDEKTGIVTCQGKTALGTLPGLVHSFVATNDALTKVWRAEVLGAGNFKLTGAPVSEADFQPEGALRLWEYGVGDQVRVGASAAVRRVEAGVYEVTANTDVDLVLPGGVKRAVTAAELGKNNGIVRVEAK